MGSKINPEARKPKELVAENKIFHGTGGVSQVSMDYNFVPAFLDKETGAIYFSCFRNGEPAAIHVYDGLPEHLVISRNEINDITETKSSLVSGFVNENQFYSREQAMAIITEIENKSVDLDKFTGYLS